MTLAKNERSEVRNASGIIPEANGDCEIQLNANVAKIEALVIMRLKIQEQSVLNFVSRIIQ